jgi:hypothetical protein
MNWPIGSGNAGSACGRRARLRAETPVNAVEATS